MLLNSCRKAYLQKIAAAHPDKGGTADHFQQVSDAYQMLQSGEGCVSRAEAKTSRREDSHCNLQDHEYHLLHSRIAAQAFCQAADRSDAGELGQLPLENL